MSELLKGVIGTCNHCGSDVYNERPHYCDVKALRTALASLRRDLEEVRREAEKDRAGLIRSLVVSSDRAREAAEASLGAARERVKDLEVDVRIRDGALDDQTRQTDLALKRAVKAECEAADERVRREDTETARDGVSEWAERIAEAAKQTLTALALGHPTCGCGKPATCVGAYEDLENIAPSCDDCCGHGNEDGWCVEIRAAAPQPAATAPPATCPEVLDAGTPHRCALPAGHAGPHKVEGLALTWTVEEIEPPRLDLDGDAAPAAADTDPPPAKAPITWRSQGVDSYHYRGEEWRGRCACGSSWSHVDATTRERIEIAHATVCPRAASTDTEVTK